MANETTFADVSSLINPIRDAATMYAMQNFFMPTLVRLFTDGNGFVDRKGSTYSGGSVSTGLGETDDLNDERQQFSRSLAYTLTPGEAGTQYFVTDRDIESNDMDTLSDLTTHIGYTVYDQVEQDLLGNFANLTAGTIGSAGGTLTWEDIYKAGAILRAAGVPGPYYCVLHEFQYINLATNANIAGLSNPAPLQIRDDIQRNYVVQNIGSNIQLYPTGVPTAGTAVVSGVFSRQALAYDPRRVLRVEPERDASARGWEWNVTHVHAHGAIKPHYGVQLIGDASMPS